MNCDRIFAGVVLSSLLVLGICKLVPPSRVIDTQAAIADCHGRPGHTAFTLTTGGVVCLPLSR
jgi:hypothetical protein